VAENESDGTAVLRFGRDGFGQQPESGTRFVAIYRLGAGAAGNVGSNTIAHVITRETAVTAVWNPLPAWGGSEPEDMEEVRKRAPFAFRKQERAVTPQDYATVAEKHPGVQRAVATRRWTGSWHTIFLTIDRVGGLPVDADFEAKIRRYLERYRLSGHDLEVDGPHYISLEIHLQVCAARGYFRSNVQQALQRQLSSGLTDQGQPGFFHPDRFSFGQPVHLSQLYAAASRVEGVESVEVSRFQRQGNPASSGLNSGKLEMGLLEIARLENNPNFPERGILKITVRGGK
jgi:predicted phage baseplate assembly protein